MKRLRSKLTYSNVVSTLCLFLLIGGGTAFAASQLEKESVGPNQLKKGAVTPIKLSNASKRTLTGPAGPVGPVGATGPTGPQGATGKTGAAGATDVVVREEAVAVVPKESFYVNYAFCNPGEVATGGGAGFNGNAGKEVIEQSFPMAGTKAEPRSVVAGEAPTGWGVYLRNNSTTPREGKWYVVCASPCSRSRLMARRSSGRRARAHGWRSHSHARGREVFHLCRGTVSTRNWPSFSGD